MADSPPPVGSEAPDFTVMDHHGEQVSLSDYRGKENVVLYFYPKADTPGCTAESCGFRDAFEGFRSIGATILGISPGTVKKQAKFAEKYHLPFRLLADADHAIAEAYGVWQEKSFMGRKYMGVERTTFLFDKNGVVREVFHKFNILTHAAN